MTEIIRVTEGGVDTAVLLTLRNNGVPINLEDAEDIILHVETLGDHEATVYDQGNEQDHGKVEFTFTEEELSESAVYSGVVEIIWDDLTNTLIPVLIDISDTDTPLAWATLTDVKTITGAIVTPETLGIASGIIEIYSGRPVSLSNRLSTRARRLLRTATAWECILVADNPDLFKASIVSGSQDGVSWTYSQSSTPELHPFARRALLSLPQFGTQIVPFKFNNTRRSVGSFVMETSDIITTIGFL